MVNNLPCSAGRMGSIPGCGTKIQHKAYRPKLTCQRSCSLIAMTETRSSSFTTNTFDTC